MASPDIKQFTGPGRLRGTIDTTAWPLNSCQAQVSVVSVRPCPSPPLRGALCARLAPGPARRRQHRQPEEGGVYIHVCVLLPCFLMRESG
jgi:hypothetical protein